MQENFEQAVVGGDVEAMHDGRTLTVNAVVGMGAHVSARSGRLSVGTSFDEMYVSVTARQTVRVSLLKHADAALLALMLTAAGNRASIGVHPPRVVTSFETRARGSHGGNVFVDDPIHVAAMDPSVFPGLGAVVIGFPGVLVTPADALLLAEEVGRLAETLSWCSCGCGKSA